MTGVPEARQSSSTAAPAVGRSAPGRPRGAGTSCSPGRSAACGARSRTSPTWLTSASTSSTSRRSTRSAPPTARGGTTASAPAPTTPAARGRSAAPAVGTMRCTPTWAPSTTSTRSWPAAADQGLEIALDYALQCSPDHPWVHDHPEWFTRRPDGSIRYAENPPKKYQDIHPIDFWPEADADRVALWARVPRRPRALDRARRPHLPGRQPAHQAAGVLGVGDRRRPRPPPRGRLPGRGVHRPGDDGEAGRGRVHAELHVLHLAARRVGAARVRHRAHPGPAGGVHAARRSGPTRPTSSTTTSATRRPAAFAAPARARRDARAALRHLLRLRARARTSRPTTPRRSTAHSEKYEIKARDYDAAATRSRR